MFAQASFETFNGISIAEESMEKETIICYFTNLKFSYAGIIQIVGMPKDFMDIVVNCRNIFSLSC